MLPIPNFSLYSWLEYVLLAGGVVVGFNLFTAPMKQVESFIANLRK